MGTVFLDEAGDPGMDIARGASKFLIIAGVHFAERGYYDDWEHACRLWLRKSPEFKFGDRGAGARTSFGHLAARHQWTWRAVACDKAKLREVHDPEELYRRIAGYALGNLAKIVPPGSEAFFDDRGFPSGGAELLRAQALERKEVEPPWSAGGAKYQNGIFTRVGHRKSHDVVGIQLADFVAGSIAQRANGRPEWQDIIAAQGAVQFWPR